VKEVLTLDKQRRIYVRRDLFASAGVEIPTGKAIKLWAFIGESGQLQLLARENPLSRLRDLLEDQNLTTEWDASGDENVTILTQLQSFLSIACVARSAQSTIEVTLPAEAVKLGLVAHRGAVSVVTKGRIFEIWGGEAWKQAGKIVEPRAFTEDAERALDRLE
jgi:DNA-binding transcriptional regulator/RsmH inhibitor MraZ